MGLYKLIAGRHNEGGVDYSVGDVVESEINLEQMLAGKFISIPDASPAAVEPVEEEVEEVEVVEEPPKKKRRARKSK